MNTLYSWYQESAFSSATWVDWLDMTLLAVVVYQVLLLMRGTRALQSLAGIFLVGVLYVVAEYTGLSTTHWVLDNLFVYAVLALLILFQEDIRRALARFGGTFARPTHLPSEAAALEEVIKAVFHLAHRKIGALIVIERQASLEPWCDNAHMLDATVSQELLFSVFHPSSPLHDGAVLLAKQRIRAAGVFLPISLSKDVSKALGTRHRAAVGIAEQTDAVCLVVSEERGTVALVKRGEIVPIADANDLRQRLVEGLEEEQADTEPVAAVQA